MVTHRLLIVEDDLAFATMMQTWLRKKGFEVDKVSSVGAAAKKVAEDDADFSLVLSDLRLPDGDGLQLLAWLRKKGMQLPFIVMTNYAEVQNAVQAMKSGASDYISKPIQPDILLQKINDALAAPVEAKVATPIAKSETQPAVKPNKDTKDAKQSATPKYIEGKSEASRQLYEYVGLVAPTPMSVLILGASGTGKEYVAR